MEHDSSSRRLRADEQEVDGPLSTRCRTEERVFGGSGCRLPTGAISLAGYGRGQPAASRGPRVSLEEALEHLSIAEAVAAVLEDETGSRLQSAGGSRPAVRR